ncbi:hypothetical protein GCM10022288_29810 [Gryllotalpicola kribbensis]|jgi:hypothetical protein|uniref:Lipoprotein n=1 Tax=Gryllotalpicola kribbensis TaxID=993084 RepID=A0ABP8AZM3_9MICO
MRRTVTALALAAAVLALAGCAGSATPSATTHTGTTQHATATPTASPASPASAADCDGVFVTVQFGLLGATDIDACAPATGPITAAAALKEVDVTTAGTQKYGDQVVCRVNGSPSASTAIDVPGHDPYTETCQSMPAAYAYWAVWVKDAGKWDYAASSITTQQVKPGQTLGLKFTTGTDTTPPQG